MVDKSLLIAGNAFQLIQDFYPTFLAEAGYQDTWLARVTFYKLIIESTQATGLSDARAQSQLMARLLVEKEECNQRLQDEIYAHLLEM